MASMHSLFVLSVLCIFVGQAYANDFWAAVCIARTNQCNENAANLSKKCQPNRWAVSQWKKCRQAACSWCSPEWRQTIFPCNAKPIGRVCGLLSPTPSVTPTPSPGEPSSASPPSESPKPTTPPKNGPCSYRPLADGKHIVVNMGSLPGKDGWTHVRRDGFKGLIFRKDLYRGIAKKGKQGVYCFDMVASQSGTYQLTAWSFTTHMTDHNDVWVRSSLGFSLWYDGRYWKNVGPSNWLKAYQNNAGYFADYLHTKDWDPHRFLIPNVVAGETFNVCISGRSYRYEMYKLVVKKCEGQECRGYKMSSTIKNLPSSTCM